MGKWSGYEKRLLSKLGLKPAPGSGSGWIHKEDGESDSLLVQLKSTEGKSITVKKQDVDDLLYHARIAHKTPVFVLSFVDSHTMVCVLLDDVDEISAKFRRNKV